MVNVVIGDNSDNSLVGKDGEENNISGSGGNDTITGRGKNDLLLGGSGNDVIFGANGNDVLFGGLGDDGLDGGNGSDTLSGDKGENTLTGGNGDDTFVINLNAADGNTTIEDFDIGRQLRNMTYNDSLLIDNVSGQAFVFAETPDGDVTLTVDGEILATIKSSGDGALKAADVLRATEFAGGTPSNVELLDKDGVAIKFSIAGTQGDDQIIGQPGIEQTIAGNDGDDAITGRGKDDVLLGGRGEDTLNGGNGADTLFGGDNDDQLFGGSGSDVLSGDRGSDTLTGGTGDDTFVLNAALEGVDTITDYVVGDDQVEVRNPGSGLNYDAATGELSDDNGLIAIFSNTPNEIDFV